MTTTHPSLLANLRGRYIDLRNGLVSGYPLCCVVRFATCRYAHQGAMRGGEHGWVACGIFHRRTQDQYDWDSYLHPGWKKDRYDGPCAVPLEITHSVVADRLVAMRARRELSADDPHVHHPLRSVLRGVHARLAASVARVRHGSDLPSGDHQAAGEPTLAGSALGCSGEGR